MFVECITIVLIISMISSIFLRTKRRRFALLSLPLILVPAMHVVAQLVLTFIFPNFDQMAQAVMTISFDLAGLLVGGLLEGMLLHHLPGKRTRVGFAVIAAFYMIALTVVLMTSLLF